MKSASTRRLYANALIILSLLAPTAAAQKPARTATPARQKAQPTPAASPTPTAPRKARPAAAAGEEKESAEVDRVLEDVVAGDGYAYYMEIRSVGQFVRSKEVGELIEAIKLLGPGAKEVEEYLGFFTSNAEQLNDVKSIVMGMPTRSDLPQFLGAQEFPTVEAARLMEPKLRVEMNKVARSLMGDPAATAEAPDGQRPRAAATVKSSGAKQPAAETPKSSVIVKRFGRLVLMSDEPFTLKALKGEDAPALAENGRFQMVRSRLSSEPLFIYFDITLAERGAEIERERWEREQKERELAMQGTAAVTVVAPPMTEAEIRAQAGGEDEQGSQGEDENVSAEMAETMVVTEEDQSQQTGSEAYGPETPGRIEGPPQPAATLGSGPSSGSGSILRSFAVGDFIFGTSPKWPDALGAALALEDDSLVVRALLVNHAGELIAPIPFISSLIAGPSITPQAATLAPAGTDIFISASLDATQIFNRMLNSASESFNRMQTERTQLGDKGKADELTPEAMLAAAELLVGFKIKDDFLPAIGNELAVSLPAKWFTGGGRFNDSRRRRAEEEGEGDSIVVLVALNNTEAVQKMLPHVLELAGIKSVAAQDQAVSHNGVKIHVYGGLALAYVNNFLAFSWDAPSIKRVVDAYTGQGTLAADERYREATAWEPKQNLASAYVSRAFVEGLYKEVTKWADPNDPEVQQLLTRLNVRPRAASYAVTDEGGGVLLHELRLPTAALKLVIAEEALRQKIGPVRGAESMALSTLVFIREMEESQKKAKGAYASLEEFAPKPTPGTRDHSEYHPLSKKNLESGSYRIELSASGDKYAVTATPKDYGKPARRSFFMDETGIIRAADRGGQPATSSDPPID